jgi:hypothetical protein
MESELLPKKKILGLQGRTRACAKEQESKSISSKTKERGDKVANGPHDDAACHAEVAEINCLFFSHMAQVYKPPYGLFAEHSLLSGPNSVPTYSFSR